MRKCNQEGRSLIKFYEGLQLTAYKDIVGVPTVGYGHTGSDVVYPGRITLDEAERMFDNDISKFESGVNSFLTGSQISDNAFSALVSFSYNLGLTNLKNSTLLKLVNLGRMNEAGIQFTKWDRAGGKEVAGLFARRRAERDLFLKPDPVSGATGAVSSPPSIPS